MKIEHRFTDPTKDAYSEMDFSRTSSEIRNPDGTIVFSQHDIEIPGGWSHCLLYTSPSPRDGLLSRMPSSA